MKWMSDIVARFVVRMIAGIAIILFVNQFLVKNEIDVMVGVNPVTAVTSGVLGVPGVCLLYGIVLYQGF